MADDTEKQLPQEIAKAVIGVMGKLGTLAKENDNKFDKYKFASIDDFLAFVRGHCFDEGIFFIPQEAEEPRLVEFKKKDGNPMMMWWCRFSFLLAHTSGAVYGPIYKTVQVQAGGAQAAGSAQSYALKQLMRGLFMIPTGDGDDPDKKTTAELTTTQNAPNTVHARGQRLYKNLNAAKTKEAFLTLWNSDVMFMEELREANPSAFDHLEKLRVKKLEEFGDDE